MKLPHVELKGWDKFTVLILAGGMARRMHGRDKGLIEVGGRAMVSMIIDQLKGQCRHLIVNANRNIEKYEQLGFPVYADIYGKFQGPLAGIYTGLSKIHTEWMITLPCDGPFVAEDYCQRMLEQTLSADRKIGVAYSGGRIQPVYSALHHSLSDSLFRYLESGERKIDRWHRRHGCCKVDFTADDYMFANINTAEQLKEFDSR